MNVKEMLAAVQKLSPDAKYAFNERLGILIGGAAPESNPEAVKIAYDEAVEYAQKESKKP